MTDNRKFYGLDKDRIAKAVRRLTDMARKSNREQVLKEAWIGDAVLSLYARRRILFETGRIDAQREQQMTSNRFLSSFREASETEAEIGRVFERDGSSAAFEWIESNLMPIYERQEANRRKRLGRTTVA